MSKNSLQVGGFPERSPTEQELQNKIKRIIEDIYASYGYVNIETPAVERVDVLTSKSGADVSKQIYGLYGLAQGINDTKDYALHFDLTIPLARYVIDHEEELAFPFKRSQLQKVRRGERHQAGRFKEFYQCDIDVIDKEVDIGYDAEIIKVLYDTIKKILNYLEIEETPLVLLNNRKIYDALFDHLELTPEQRKQVLETIDNHNKIGKDEFEKKLGKILNNEDKEIITNTLEGLRKEQKYIDTKGFNAAYQELQTVLETLREGDVVVAYDPYTVRGLDYYNGTVFETILEGNKGFGSICSGGRFDNLVGYIRDATGKKGGEYEGVGGSIGLTRLLARLNEANMIKVRPNLADVIVFNTNDIYNKQRAEIGTILRNGGLRIDEYMRPDKLAKQFAYAQKKSIPFGIFMEEQEVLKGKVRIRDLETREEIICALQEAEKSIKQKL